MARAIRSILVANLRYVGLNLKPFLFMLVPVLLVLAQTEARLGYRPLEPGDSVIVKTFWNTPTPLEGPEAPRLTAGDGAVLETPPLRIASGAEIDWRIGVTGSNPASLELRTPHGELVLPLAVSNQGLVPLSPWNGDAWSPKMLLFPAARPVSGAGPELRSLEVDYPRKDVQILGRDTHWIWPFLVLTLVAGYALKGVFRVQL